MAKEKFTCPDCCMDVEEEGLCPACRAAYAKACEDEGAGDCEEKPEEA